jgi:hypothetical protein
MQVPTIANARAATGAPSLASRKPCRVVAVHGMALFRDDGEPDRAWNGSTKLKARICSLKYEKYLVRGIFGRSTQALTVAATRTSPTHLPCRGRQPRRSKIL